MADKQDNRSEQWLQDYARRRREQHGPAPKMHDATRRMLHGEVQRTWGQPTPTSETAGGWEAWLLRFATGAVAVGVLALGVWVTTDRANNAGSTMKMTQADSTQPVEESGASKKQNEVEDLLDAKRDKDALAAAEAKRTDRPRLVEEGRTIENPTGIAEALANPASASRREVFSVKEDSPSQRDVPRNMHHKFSQQVQSAREESIADSQGAVVASSRRLEQEIMRNFEVIRDGEIARVRDEDGSIYTGRVIFATAAPMFAAKGIGAGIKPNKGIGAGTKPTPELPVVIKPQAPQQGETGKTPSVVRGGGLRPFPYSTELNNKRGLTKFNPAVPNDHINRPLPVILPPGSPSKSTIGHNLYATRQSGRENHYPNFHGSSVWYLFKATGTGIATVSTRGSHFDTTLGVFTGNSPGTIQLIPDVDGRTAWNNDQPNAPWSKVSFPCEAGKGYRIAVDGVNGATGQFKLTLGLDTGAAAVGAATKALADHRNNALFYFQVAGNSVKSGKLVQFEGFVRNVSLEEEDARLKDLAKGRGRLEGEAPLQVQGRANDGGQWLTVDAITASLTPVHAAPSKSKSQNK